nr:hypothetical protein [Tanacetum cinerariifolium]
VHGIVCKHEFAMFVNGLTYVNGLAGGPLAGGPLGAYDLSVATPRALVYASVMTSGDARSEGPLRDRLCQPLVFKAPLTDEEFEVSKPLDTRITPTHSSASSDSTTLMSPDHPLTQASPTPTPTRVSFHRRTACMVMRTYPTLSPGMSARIAEASALSLSSFCKRYRSSYETSSSSSPPALPIRKRYRGTSELVEDTEDESSDSGTETEGHSSEGEGHILESEGLSLEDEGPGLEGKGHGLEDEGPGIEEEEAAPEDPKDDKVYTDIPTDVPPATHNQTLSSHEWSSSSLPVSPSPPVVSSPIASPVTTPTSTISINEDQFLDVGAQLELHRSIFYDYTQCLDALPPIVFEGYDRDLRELYARSGAIVEERRKRLDLTDRVARMEKTRESRGE